MDAKENNGLTISKLISIVTGYIGLSLILSCSKWQIPYDISKTCTQIDTLMSAVILYRRDHQVVPIRKDSKSNEQISQDIYSSLVAVDSFGKTYLDPNGLGDIFIDPYGNYLNIMLSDDTDGVTVLDSKVTIADGVAIWSNGRNGTNEYGKGDDITGWYSCKENWKRIWNL